MYETILFYLQRRLIYFFLFLLISNVSIIHNDLYLLSRNRQLVWYICLSKDPFTFVTLTLDLNLTHSSIFLQFNFASYQAVFLVVPFIKEKLFSENFVIVYQCECSSDNLFEEYMPSRWSCYHL